MSSRYRDCPQATVTVPDGQGGTREVAYLLPRPAPVQAPVIARHRVADDDRLDLIAATYLGDPTAYWAVCDANLALDPDDLVAPDRRGTLLDIPAPGV